MMSQQKRLCGLTVLCVLLTACSGDNNPPPVNNTSESSETSESYQFDDRGPLVSPNLTRLRGAACCDELEEQNFVDLAAMGANLVRWHIGNAPDYDPVSDAADISRYRDAYLIWLETEMQEAELAAESAEHHGMYMILDQSSPPGWRPEDGGGFRMLYDDDLADLFVEAWEIIATRFINTTIYAFEIVNEPSLHWWDEDTGVWDDLFLRAVAKIRAIDPDRTVVYEPISSANAKGFIELDVLPIDNVIYSFHFYHPFEFTHQDMEMVLEPNAAREYPGTIPARSWEQEVIEYSGLTAGDENYWDKEMLRIDMQPVLDFQLRHNVPIWVGEFSAARWAPNHSTYRYLRDCLELFEEYGWDWTYHIFRSSDVWSFELETDRSNYTPSATPTDRQLLLEYYFDLNEPATWPDSN